MFTNEARCDVPSFSPVLFIRRKLLHPAHTEDEGITRGEQQENYVRNNLPYGAAKLWGLSESNGVPPVLEPFSATQSAPLFGNKVVADVMG